MYHALRYIYPTDEDGGYYDVNDGLAFDGVSSWATGLPFTARLPHPIIVDIVPISGFHGGLPELMDGNMCLMSDRLVEALTSAGVENIDVYPAVLRDEENEREFSYQAVNIIGLIAGADLERSAWKNLDGPPVLDTHFDRLVIDEDAARGRLLFRLAESSGTIVIHQKVKDLLESAGFPTLQFEPLR